MLYRVFALQHLQILAVECFSIAPGNLLAQLRQLLFTVFRQADGAHLHQGGIAVGQGNHCVAGFAVLRMGFHDSGKVLQANDLLQLGGTGFFRIAPLQVIHCLTGLQVAQGLGGGSLCQLGALYGHIILTHRFLGFFKALIAGFAHIGGTQHTQYAVAHVQYFGVMAAINHLGAEHGFLHGLRQFGGSGFGGGGRKRAPQDNNLSTSTRITLPQSYTGTKATVFLPDGTSTEARIPAGVKDGQKVRVRGKGLPGTGGDLIVTVRVSDDPHYSREGNNLVLRAPVTLEEAVNGGVLEVPVPGGKTVKLRLTPGSVGRKLRAKGRGFTTKSGTGDLLVIPEVHLPQNLSDEAKEAFEKFIALAPQENPREDLLKKVR